MFAVQRLDAVCEVSMGQAPGGGAYNDEGDGWPLIAGAGDFGELYPAPKKYTSEASKLSKPGDIILGIRATIGVKVLSDSEYCLGRGVAGLRPKANLDTRYLWHWIEHVRPTLAAKGKGATFKQVNKQDIGELEIALPTLPEQRRIAAILDQADALRAKRREALVQLDSLTQSIFIEMFGDLFLNSHRYPVSKLGDLCDVRDGTHDSPKFHSEGYPLVTTKNLRNGQIDLSEVSLISEEDYLAINKRSKVDMGDILMPMIGTIGNPVLVEMTPEFAIKNMALIKFLDSSPDRQFILHFLKSDCFDKIVAKKNKGGTQKFLALGEIRSLPIPVPPETVQEKFVALMAAIRSLGEKLEASLSEQNSLFTSLQHCAFRGEL